MNNTYIEYWRLGKHLDDSFSNIAGGATHHTAPQTPQQKHLQMVKRFYRHNPQPIRFNRSFRLSPIAIKWMGNRGAFLFGYPYEIIYPLFNEVNRGIYNENDLRSRFEFSDEQWNDLMLNLTNSGFFISY